ncbi:hypothetical protein MycrhDRAFT_6906 [Mycolicibacterium rhodesiae JS60]|nr:hypothetical protein MycrhDRAFT_6906 [Mycolicibacterium rhodesiae JS60]
MANKGGMATGIEVARISVKVSPDTKEFRSKLQRELTAIENSLKGEVPVVADFDENELPAKVKAAAKAAASTVKVKADVDTNGIRRKLDMLNLAFERRVRSALDIKPLEAPSHAGMQRRLGTMDLNWDRRVQKFLNDIKPIRLELDPGFDDRFRQRLEKAAHQGLKDGVDQTLKRHSANAEIELNTAHLMRELAEAKARAEAAIGEVDVALRPDFKGFAGARARLRALIGRIRVPVDADVDNRSVRRSTNAITGLFSGLKKLVPNFGSGINPAGYVAILAGVVLVAAPLIGLISTLVLAIPGLISSITTPLMAVVLGLDGIKKAAKDSGLFFSDEDGKLKFGADLDGIKAEVSKAFEVGLKKPFEDIKNAIPGLLDSMPKVAKGLSDMFRGFTDSMTSPEGIGLFDKTVQNIANAMSQAAPGVASFTTGMLRLSEAFTHTLPGLSQWFNRTGDSFAKWVEQMSKPKGIGASVLGGSSPFDDAFAGLGDTLRTIGNWIVDLGKSGMDFISNKAKMDDFIETLRKLGDVLSGLVELGNQLGPVWDFLANLSTNKKWRETVEADPRENPASNLMEQLTGNRGPEPPPVKNKDWLDWLFGDMSEAVKGGLEAAGEKLNNPLELLLGKPGEWISNSLGFGVAAADAGQQLGAQLGTAVGQGLKGAVNAGPMKVEGADASEASQQAVETLKSSLTQLPAAASESFAGLQDAAGASVQGVVDQFRVGGNLIVAAVQQWPGAIAQALAGLQAAGANAGNQLVAGLVGGINAGIPSVVSAAQAMAKAADVAARAALGIHSPSKVFEQIGGHTAEGFGIGMENGFQPVLEQAKGLAAQIAEAFSTGADPTGLINGFNKQEISRMEKVLGFEGKRLTAQARALDYQAKAAGKGPIADSLKARAQEIREQQAQLSLQKDMLDLTQEYSDTVDSTGDDPLVKAASGLLSSPVNFAKATGQQFLSDIGISGNGVLSKAISEGIQYIFQIGSVDEALSIKDRETSKNAMSIVGGAR